ncbi:putative zinc metalloprotease [Ixodes scapularis]
MVLKRYRTAITIAVIGAMSCIGAVLFSLTVSRQRQASSSSSASPPPPPSCNSTPCLLEAEYLKDRLSSDAPCSSFYDWVCSSGWTTEAVPEKRLFAASAQGSLMTRLNATLHGFPPLAESLLRGCCTGHYALLGLDLFRACEGSTRPATWEQLSRILRRVGLSGWPLPLAALQDRTPWDLAGLVDLHLGVFPLVRVSLRRYFGRVTLQLDRRPLPLRLHQLTVPLQDLRSYADIVEKALSLLPVSEQGRQNDSQRVDDEHWRSAAIAIVELEQALERTVPRDSFVRGPRLIRVRDLPRSRHWNWAEYMAAVRDDSSLLADPRREVLVHDPEMLAFSTELLANASAAALFNYLGYRVLVHLAPLLPDEAAFLLPLSPVPRGAPLRLAGCLRLVSQIHPFSFRFFAGLDLGTNETIVSQLHYVVPAESKGRAAQIFAEARSATARLVEALSWKDPKQKLQRASAVFRVRLDRGGISESANRGLKANVSRGRGIWPAPAGFLDAFLHAQSANAYWLASGPDDGLDSRHQDDPFSLEADYFEDPNVVHVSPALSAALDTAVDGLEPLWQTKVSTPLVNALLRAVLPGEPERLLRLHGRDRCLAKQYNATLYDRHLLDRFRETLAIRPLLEVFLRSTPVGSSESVADLWVNVGKWWLSGEQLFFVHWALAQCEEPQRQRRMRHFKETPTKLRINVPLANLDRFQAAWQCPKGSAMRPWRMCSFVA